MNSRREIKTTGENEEELLIPKNPRFHLHLVQKASEPSGRPIIPSTKWERLSFYRAYCSTPNKIELLSMSHLKLNDAVWFYVLNLFLKSLPHGFVHFFMASYAPEEHIFLTKMVPICSGFKYLSVVSAFFEMFLSTETIILLFHYSFDGIVRKNPWNRCINATYYDIHLDLTMHCYDFVTFGDIVFNKSIYYDKMKYSFVNEYGQYFQIAAMEYYRLNGLVDSNFTLIRNIIYCVIIWLGVSFFHTLVEKKIFWKLLNGCQWTVNAIDFTTFIYLLVIEDHTHGKLGERSTEEKEFGFFTFEYWATDVDILAESITAPAVIHILTARSTQEISPGTDCANMVISNALLYLFKSLLFFEIKKYVESFAHITLHVMDFYQRSWFFYWPIFYSDFFLGNIYSIVFMFCNGMTELLVLMVVYHCLIQTITYEWPKIRIWIIKGLCFVLGLLLMVFTNIWRKAVLFIYSRSIVTLTESVFLYILYPLGRFVDDYTFHYGSPPTRLRILNLRLVPVYYTFKFYFMMNAIWIILSQEEIIRLVPYFQWLWSLMLIPLFLGVLSTIYIYLIKQRMTWQYMFRPMPKWGPRDFSERQLRKQYSSRYYISSEAPKLLSRYLMSKRESKVYKVDVRYDIQRRSTVSKAVGFGTSLSVDKKRI